MKCMKWNEDRRFCKRAWIPVLLAAFCSIASGQIQPPVVVPATKGPPPLPSQSLSSAPQPAAPPTVALPTVGGTWAAGGPGPITGGQAIGTPNNTANDLVNGAIKSVAAHPTDASTIYVGTVNGGIWKTTNATVASPTWVPLTDTQSSLSMSALKFDPTDATNNTLVAGVGRFSALALIGGSRTGLLRTTNGGANWTPLNGGGTLTGKNIAGVGARGATILAAVDIADSFTCGNIGIFRSTNTGAGFTMISGSGSGLPLGSTYDLAGDPSNNATLYTAVVYAHACAGATNGVYKSTDTGLTWSLVSNATINALLIDSTTVNVKIAVGAANNVYVGIENNGQLAGLFRSGDGGSTWQSLDIPFTTENGTQYGINPGGQGNIHFSIVADPTNANVVYVGGDRQPANNENGGVGVQFPNSLGATNYTGRLFRVDASKASGSQFTHLTDSNSLGPIGGGTAHGTAPHADSRGMAFDANGNILEVGDGGIYRRTSPKDNTGDWFGLVGSLQVTELHDIAYDANSKIILGGAQDNGFAQQSATGSPGWAEISQGDGGDAEARLSATAGIWLRYSSSNSLSGFRLATYNASNVLQSTTFPALTVISGVALQLGFNPPIKANAVDPARIVIGGSNSLYESLNQGSQISQLPGNIVANDDTNHKAIVYGGTSQAVPNPNLIYVGAASNVLVRTAAAPATFTTLTAYPGAGSGRKVNGIVVDPTDYRIAYVVDPTHVYRTPDTGTTWTDITGNLVGAFTGSIQSIEFVSNAGTNGVVVGTDQQVYLSLTSSLGTWTQLGTGLPNAQVDRLSFDPVNNVLVVGTLGRGAWTLAGAVSGGKKRRGQLVSN